LARPLWFIRQSPDLIKENVNLKKILYIPLDNPLYAGLCLEKILLVFFEFNENPENETAYLFFDEIQHFKDWELHLKSLVDSYPQHRFIDTGSAAAALKLKSGESGAGRFADFILPSMTFHEYIKFIGMEEELSDKNAGFFFGMGKTINNIKDINAHFIKYLNFGGYP